MARVWVVFGRSKHEEALTRLGTVAIDGNSSVEDRVREEHGDGWMELVAVPESSVQWAIGEERRT